MERISLVIAIVLVALLAALLLASSPRLLSVERISDSTRTALQSPSEVPPDTAAVRTSAAPAQPSIVPLPPDAVPGAPSARLIVPVQGVAPEDLVDTFNDARSQGREHNAIDIMAPKGTPVLAAADGRIVRLFVSERGGTTIYQRGTDLRTIYYYAHLDRYADDLREGDSVQQGEVIGYVGDTGNAVPGNYHLHFAIWIAADSTQFWDGVERNPYSLLQNIP